MIDFTQVERTVFGLCEGGLVYRQANDFSLVKNGMYICNLDSDACKKLIELMALVEVGTNEVHKHDTNMPEPDDAEWVYAPDPRLYAPNWELEK